MTHVLSHPSMTFFDFIETSEIEEGGTTQTGFKRVYRLVHGAQCSSGVSPS